MSVVNIKQNTVVEIKPEKGHPYKWLKYFHEMGYGVQVSWGHPKLIAPSGEIQDLEKNKKRLKLVQDVNKEIMRLYPDVPLYYCKTYKKGRHDIKRWKSKNQHASSVHLKPCVLVEWHRGNYDTNKCDEAHKWNSNIVINFYSLAYNEKNKKYYMRGHLLRAMYKHMFRDSFFEPHPSKWDVHLPELKRRLVHFEKDVSIDTPNHEYSDYRVAEGYRDKLPFAQIPAENIKNRLFNELEKIKNNSGSIVTTFGPSY